MKLISKVVLTALIISGAAFFLTNCKKDSDPTLTPPEIISFTPTAGIPGTSVVITGKNFSATASENQVSFNGTSATVTTASTTSLSVIVPAGSSTGKISISVKNNTVASAGDFTVLPPTTTITSFSPVSGIAGTAITINGSNFSTTPSDNVLKFNGVLAIVTAATNTSITVSVPVNATTGKIAVTANSQTASSTTDFIIPIPTITTVAPLHALPGASIVVNGTNFVAGSLTLNGVKINGTDATVTAATATQLTVTVPTGATTGKISVNVAGQSVVSANDFEVLIDIPRDGLVAFYPFSGNANDMSGNNLNGTVNGNTTLTTDRFGNNNDAYNLDGVDGYINMGNPAALQIDTKITIAGWVDINAFNSPPSPGSKAMAIVTKIYFDPNVGGNPRKGYTFSQNFYGGGTPAFSAVVYSSSGGTITSFNSAYVTDSSDPLTINNWIFIAMVIDGLNVKFYKNGVKTYDQDGAATALTDGSLGEFNIGRYGGGFYFNGKVDDFVIYNKALDAAAISQLYSQTFTKY